MLELGSLCAPAMLIAINWLAYIRAVLDRHVSKARLGCFLAPLVNVALGCSVLKERINRG